MADGFYEGWFKAPGFGPNWMHDAIGDAYWGAIGKVMDQQVARLKTGIRARFPDDAAAAGMDDALELIGHDRMLPRGGLTPGAGDEPLATWATRLKDAWTTWMMAGSARGLLWELSAQGFPSGVTGVSVCNHLGRRYYLDDDGVLVVSTPAMLCENRTAKDGQLPTPRLQGFTLDVRDQFYSHFCLLILEDIPALTNDPGNMLKALLNQSVARWRQGGAHYAGAAIVPDGAKAWGWPNTLKWGQADLTWGTNGARFIAPE